MADEPEARPHILVVDDNEQNRALARATLELEDYDVELAKSGEEGLSAFGKRTPDCVLLDVRMPVMDGFETCRRMRALPSGVDVPIIFLTAARDVDTFDRAQACGADDFVTKPVQPTEMVLRVQAAMKVRRLDATNKQYFELVRRQRDDLMRLQLQKERLSSFVVHDLKNPVSTIDLLAQLLQRDKKLPAEARGAAEAIRVEVASLLRLILNLLDINKSEEGQLSVSLVPLDLRALAVSLMGAAQVGARSKEIELIHDLNGVETISADPDLLRRVLENLLDNALRYAPKGSRVSLSAVSHANELELRVADQGKGVPKERREGIFERFVQLESGERTAPRTGRGLGLTFCRLAIEAHGGRICVEDAPGAVFCIRLPRRD